VDYNRSAVAGFAAACGSAVGVTSFYAQKRFIFLQSESFDLARITTREQTANAGKIMLDKTTGA
jgi:hypothetical protein